MQIINPVQFAEIAYQQPLNDVYAGIETISNRPAGPWARAEGGPILLGFQETCVLLRQPLGRRHIEMCLSSVDQWSAVAKQAYPAVLVGVMQIFGERNSRQDQPSGQTRVTKATIYQDHETGDTAGMILELSAGNSFGVDALSAEGLAWFLHAQTDLFRREYLEVKSLQETVLAKP